MKANIDKCHLFLKQLKVLGSIVSEHGIHTDPELVKDMIEVPTPDSKTKVRSFLHRVFQNVAKKT